MFTQNCDSDVKKNKERLKNFYENRKSFKDHFVSKVLDFNSIERDFSKIHLLVDSLFVSSTDLPPQNSYLFQLKLSLLLSAMVQMKNTLVKYMDYELSD